MNSEQQDAAEFFVLICQAIEEEAKRLEGGKRLLNEGKRLGFGNMSRESTVRQISFSKFAMNTSLMRLDVQPAENLSLIQEVKVRNPFQALMAHRTSCCTCGYTEAVRHLPSDHLTLNVPHTVSFIIFIPL